MDRVALLQRWQAYDPLTGGFDLPRTNRQFAALLGIHESYLSKCYAGEQVVGMKALDGLARIFPEARGEIVDVLGRPLDPTPQPVAAGGDA